MATTEKVPPPARRKPRTFEFTLLYGWHAIISGAFIVAYLSGDEDTFVMHQFAGYVVLSALFIRLLASLLAPTGSPLRLRRPDFAPLATWAKTVLAGGTLVPGASAALPRRPLFTAIAAALLIGLGAAASSGAVADFVPIVEDVHEAMAEMALWIVLGHVAIVVALNALPKLRQRVSGKHFSVVSKQY